MKALVGTACSFAKTSALLLLLLTVSACTDAADESLTLELAVDANELRTGQVVLRASLHNRTKQTYRFLPWNTPFDEGVNGQFLSIVDTSSNAQLAFQGRMVKRLAPVPSDYIGLDKGMSLSNALNFSTSYNFCANRRYIISLSGSLYDTESNALSVKASPIEIQLGDAFSEC